MKEPVIELPFAAGIDQSQRSELLDPRAGFLALENVRSPSIGCVGKRDGFSPFTGTTRVDATSRTAGYRMFAHGRQTCIIDRDVIDTFSHSDEIQISRGRVPDCGLSMTRVPSPPGRTGTGVTDSIRVGSFIVICGTDVGGAAVYACIIEATTGQVILPYTAVVTGTAGEIIGLLGSRGTTAMLFVGEGSNADIMYAEIDCSTAETAIAGWSAATAAVGNADGFIRFAVCSAGTRCYLAYVNDSAGASQVSVKMFDGAAGGTTTINTSSVTPNAVAAAVTAGDTLWVSWDETTSVKLTGLSPTNLASVMATTATIITLSGSASSLGGLQVVPSATTAAGRLFANDSSGRLQMRSFVTTLGAATASGAQATAQNVQMTGAPFRVGTRYYGACRGYESTGDVAVCDLTEANAWVRPVAYLPARLSFSYPTARAMALSSREQWLPMLLQTAGSIYSGLLVKLDFDDDARWRAVPHNGVTFLSGGLVSFFDGEKVMESGFVVQPPVPELATSGAGTFSATGSGIRVFIVYEHVDACGNWHVSGVSDSVASGAFTNVENLAITVRPLGISSRITTTTDPRVRISIYATANGGEAPYHLLTTLTNTLTDPTQTYNMTAHVLGTEALFLGTGSLPNAGAQIDRRSVQGCAHLCAYNGFLIAAQGEEVFWSAQDVDGEGTWWNDNFSQAVAGGGDITALEAYEGTLFAFKRDRVYAMAGSPPNDSGTDGGLGPPQRLGVSVGAKSPFTCVTDIGIFFVSDRGVELLNRARAVEFIGEKIQATFASYPNVSAMTYDPVSSCVLIEASETRSAGLPTQTGRTFVYDLKARVWRSFDRRAVSATADVPAADGCMLWNGSTWRYGWLRSDGATYVETSEHKLDPGDVRVRMYAKTSWVHVAGIQGEQHLDRVFVQGEFVEDHDLEIGVANDYDGATFVSETYDSDAIAALTPIYLVDKDISQKTGQALMVEIEDAAPTGTASSDGGGDAALWVALSFSGMGKNGSKRASSVQRGGA